jgi:hypothetical protein
MPPAGEGLAADTVIDISHESLMRIWDRLRDWGEREADAARMLRRLADAAELHAAGQASLWRDPELQLALDWRARNHPTQPGRASTGALAPALAFLDASRRPVTKPSPRKPPASKQRAAEAERIRSRRVGRLTLAAVIAATLVAGATGVLWHGPSARQKLPYRASLPPSRRPSSPVETCPGAAAAAAGYTHKPVSKPATASSQPCPTPPGLAPRRPAGCRPSPSARRACSPAAGGMAASASSRHHGRRPGASGTGARPGIQPRRKPPRLRRHRPPGDPVAER